MAPFVSRLVLLTLFLAYSSSSCSHTVDPAAESTHPRGHLLARPVHTPTPNFMALRPTHTTLTATIPCSMSVNPMSVSNCESRPLRTGSIIVSARRSTSNFTVSIAPSDPTERADPDPNPTHRQDHLESGDSRTLSIIFFALSALLTLATIVVAIVYGAGAARATKRLLNALITNMRESSRAVDIEMGNLHSPAPPSPRANAGHTPEYSSVSSAALA